MIGKACRRGSSVRRLLGYLFTEGLAGEHGLESAHRDAHVIAGYEPAEQLEPTRDAQGRAQLSRLAALLDAHVKAGGVGPEAKPVYHLAISAAPGDRLLTDAEWADIAGQHVQHLGLVPVGDPDGVRWVAVRHADNHVHFRFHDLRHTGNTLAAGTGASTKELMSRMGHASRRAALRYQHATTDRDAAIAVALSELAGQAAPTPPAGNGATPGVWSHDG